MFSPQNSINFLKFPKGFTLFTQKTGKNPEFHRVFIDFSSKTLEKELLTSDFNENLEDFPDFFANLPKKQVFSQKSSDFQKKFEEIDHIFKANRQDFLANSSISLTSYPFLNKTSCISSQTPADLEFFQLLEYLSQQIIEIPFETHDFIYKSTLISLKPLSPDLYSLLIGDNLTILLDFRESSNNLRENPLRFPDLSSNSCETLNEETLNQLSLQKYQEFFVEDYGSLLLAETTEKTYGWAFHFCGNWCGPNYGGFTDPVCKEICGRNLSFPSEECRKCRPPTNRVDEICMFHDFCCQRSAIENNKCCGSETTSFDCSCHREMYQALSEEGWGIEGECNFVHKLMMEALFRLIKCRCRGGGNERRLWGEGESTGEDKCMPAFSCEK